MSAAGPEVATGTRSQIVITGPRDIVAELVRTLEAEEFGRAAGSPPLPVYPTSRTLARVTGPEVVIIEGGLLEVRYAVEAGGSSARAVEELAQLIPELTVFLTEQRPSESTELAVYSNGRLAFSTRHLLLGGRQ